MANYNDVVRVSHRGGWPALLNGSTRAATLEAAIAKLNRDGRAVAGVLADRPGLPRRIAWAALAVATAGFVVRSPDDLLVTEPLDESPIRMNPIERHPSVPGIPPAPRLLPHATHRGI